MRSTFIFLIIVLTLLFALNIQAATCRSEKGGYCVELETAAVAVPGLEFLNCPTIGDCISSLYFFGMGLVGISALIMMLLGGVLYTTAGDSQDQTKRARAMMTNAVGGLALALLSWLILYTINPDLVKKLELNLTEIRPFTPAQPRGEGIAPLSDLGPQPVDACSKKGGKVVGSGARFVCLEPGVREKQKFGPYGDLPKCQAAGGEMIILDDGPYCTKPFK